MQHRVSQRRHLGTEIRSLSLPRSSGESTLPQMHPFVTIGWQVPWLFQIRDDLFGDGPTQAWRWLEWEDPNFNSDHVPQGLA
jgi:hypothetical protein